MDDQKFLLLYGMLVGVLFASFRKAAHDRKVANVPIVGSSGFLASCWDGVRFIRHAPELIQRGYDMYPEGIFRVARLFRWEVFGPLISNKNKSNAKAVKILGPLIEERLAKEAELGPDWPGRPVKILVNNDFISWMLNVADEDQKAVLPLTLRIMSINMAAIHTSSATFTQALFDLTTHPEYLLPMREEAECVVAEEGWSKAALNRMVKIDSFLRESQRVNISVPLVMRRKIVAKEGFQFSDGTILPSGSYLTVAARPTHYDESKYENAAKFDGFRFARERTEYQASNDVFKRQMISTAVDHLPFGTGKHACPGRFFAAMELKAMMAHLVLNYDVKPEVEGVRPADVIFGEIIFPNPAGRVRFRKRQ
ncbi:hypothetical protein MSAN_00838000 [Mycena sanguinolenta]|uniref:Cytochrome P450 n=1 Tax=Mycena sanguinolenta TaxID=230812 RepID=A0A8H6YZQ4_9AGAR|nr:hypothetical protein MSAN_00838000 [Mycena sanguinolenta]